MGTAGVLGTQLGPQLSPALFKFFFCVIFPRGSWTSGCCKGFGHPSGSPDVDNMLLMECSRPSQSEFWHVQLWVVAETEPETEICPQRRRVRSGHFECPLLVRWTRHPVREPAENLMQTFSILVSGITESSKFAGLL